MRKVLLIMLISLFFVPIVFADTKNYKSAKYDYMTQGTFKKKANGKYVQYDKNGKKIGIYKISKGKFVRVK